MHLFILLFLAILPFCLCGPRGRWGWGTFWTVAVLGIAVGASPYSAAGPIALVLFIAAPVIGLISWACTEDLAEPEKPRYEPW